jgi:hypothetical protein
MCCGCAVVRDIHVRTVWRMSRYAKPVLFERHAVGGEYGASYATVGPGTVKTTFYPEGGGEPVTRPFPTSAG